MHTHLHMCIYIQTDLDIEYLVALSNCKHLGLRRRMIERDKRCRTATHRSLTNHFLGVSFDLNEDMFPCQLGQTLGLTLQYSSQS